MTVISTIIRIKQPIVASSFYLPLSTVGFGFLSRGSHFIGLVNVIIENDCIGKCNHIYMMKFKKIKLSGLLLKVATTQAYKSHRIYLNYSIRRSVTDREQKSKIYLGTVDSNTNQPGLNINTQFCEVQK